VAATSAHELTQSYDCKTPGCTGEASSRTGRHAYCLTCRVARGTALPDGTPIEAKPHVISRRRQGKPTGPFETSVLELLDAARHLDLAVERYKLAGPALEQAIAAWRDVLGRVAAAEPLPRRRDA
jgi:hypothetical protein